MNNASSSPLRPASSIVRPVAILGSNVENTGAPTGLVPLNHFDKYVAEQSVAATGVTAAATNSVPLVTDTSMSQQSLLTTLPNSQPAPSTSARTRVIPPSLYSDSGDDDDNDSYEQSEIAHVQDEGTKTPSPLPVSTMDPSSDDDISVSAGADGVNVTGDNDASQQPTSTKGDDAFPDKTEDTPQDPNEPIELSFGPAAAMASEGLSGHLSASLEACFQLSIGVYQA